VPHGPTREANDPTGGGAAGMTVSIADVTAIIVIHDSAAVIAPCLASLAREGVSAIVVDNASTDDGAAIAERHGAVVLRQSQNQGYGRAMNIGMRAAATRYCLLTNPDLVFDPGSVAALIEAAGAYRDAALLAPRIIEPDGRMFFQTRSLLAGFLTNEKGNPALPEGDCCAPFLSGACLLADRAIMLGEGGFDEAIFLFYEDDDLCRRISDKGHALVHVHRAVVRHARGQSAAPRPGRIFRARFHLAWSRLYVTRKWGLADHGGWFALPAALKLPLAWLMRRPERVERYAGTLAGWWAFQRGTTALSQERIADGDN
jgi:N-acetylglucosaminyl-diphospho-decaprenol L-rhamnosyltransferase